jgi:L-ascorbate metabolism protein UlaG (beta-lactamase superfamily)
MHRKIRSKIFAAVVFCVLVELFFVQTLLSQTSYSLTPVSGADGVFEIVIMEGDTVYRSSGSNGVYAPYMYLKCDVDIRSTSVYVEVTYKDIGFGYLGMEYNSITNDYQDANEGIHLQNTSNELTVVFELKDADFRNAQNLEADLRLYSDDTIQKFIVSASVFLDPLIQIYSFSEIRENFLRERPQTGELSLREDLFGSLDDLIMGTYPPLHPETKWFFTKMLDKALLEIKLETVTEGATIWQIYNHGFVVKTPSITFGIDLHDYFRTQKFVELANLIDAYFITHEHSDHFSFELIASMQKQNKPVVGPAEFQYAPIKMSKGESRTIAGLLVTAHDGLHGNIPLRQYEIITDEGIKILHTGDNQTTETLPQISDVDFMLLNSWVNESGTVSWVEGVRYAIDKIKPKLTLPGHIMELGHLGAVYPSVPYRDPIASDNGSLASDYCILAWGENYHWGGGPIDFTRPNIVDSLNAEAYRDSILVTWNITEAQDGDLANYYRVIINNDNTHDTLLTKNEIVVPIEELKTYNFKILSYDDWGNQSIDWAQIDFTAAPEINYPPRVLNLTPSNKDTIKTFSGVNSLFTIDAMDFNNDQLDYKWKIDDSYVSSESLRCKIIGSDLDSGMHVLSAIISDSIDSTIASWNIYHQTDLAIVDNEDSLMYSDFGTWMTATQQKAYGISCRVSRINNVGDYAQYKFVPQKNGIFDLFQIILRTTFASNSVLYKTLMDGQKIDSVYIDQNLGSGDWVKIGTYSFQKNSEVIIQIINDGSATDGASMVSDAVKFIYTGEISDVKSESTKLYDNFNLYQNYPNPFNTSTTIKYHLPAKMKSETMPTGRQAAKVKLIIYDTLGREVATLVNQKQRPSNYEVTWDASKQPSGVYFYELRMGDYKKGKKMLLMK